MFYRILGINHERYVGIYKGDGKAYTFHKTDVDKYREPITKDEMNDCQVVAMWYQFDCDRAGVGKMQEALLTPVPAEDMYDLTILKNLE